MGQSTRKIFISQPMNGMSDAEIIKRRDEINTKVNAYFKEECIFIDSFHKPIELVNKGRVAMLGHSIQLMADADVVVFGVGYEDTNGCKIEYNVCQLYHIPTLYETELGISKLSPAMNLRNNANVVYWR